MLNKHSLILRLGIVLVLCSLIVGVVAVKYYYRAIFLQEVEKSNHALTQLHLTVSNTASIAVYLNDTDLAHEVINGLKKNDNILAVDILSNNLPLAKSEGVRTSTPLSYPLNNPFFDNEELGTMVLYPATLTIEARAKSIAKASARLLITQTVLVLLAFTIVAYFIVTKPMGMLSQQLEKVIPGNKNRLQLPFGHSNSEIGTMTHNINKVLAKTELLFNQERELRAEVQELEQRLRLLFEHASAAMILAQRDNGEIMLYNKSTQRLLQCLDVDANQSLYAIVEQVFDEPQEVIHSLRTALDNEDLAHGEYRLNTQDKNKPMWVHVFVSRSEGADNDTYLQIFINDITHHKTMLADLREAATTDKLTQLLNRHGGERAINKRLNEHGALTLMLIDLDEFKPINDIHGHNAGDHILQFVASQLRDQVRRTDDCIRWGGDEFVVVLDPLSEDKALAIATQIRAAISQRTQLKSNDMVSVDASIGIALAPVHGRDLNTLIKAADAAMYEVKKDNKNGVQLAR